MQIVNIVLDWTCINDICLPNCKDPFKEFDLVTSSGMANYVLSSAAFDQNRCFTKIFRNDILFVSGKIHYNSHYNVGNSKCQTHLQLFWHLDDSASLLSPYYHTINSFKFEK